MSPRAAFSPTLRAAGLPRWGSRQLTATTMAEKLSYNRPFTTRGAELENYLFNAEYPMIRWLERNYKRKDFFLTIETFDPHEPYFTPQRYKDLYPDDYDTPEYGYETTMSVGPAMATQVEAALTDAMVDINGP